MSINVTRITKESPSGTLDVAQIDVDGDSIPDLEFVVFPGTTAEEVADIAERLVRDRKEFGVTLDQLPEA